MTPPSLRVPGLVQVVLPAAGSNAGLPPRPGCVAQGHQAGKCAGTTCARPAPAPDEDCGLWTQQDGSPGRYPGGESHRNKSIFGFRVKRLRWPVDWQPP